jgi:multiple sugar transport system permease protein
MQNKSTSWYKKPENFALLLIIPLQIIMNLVGLFPLIAEIYVSFTNWSPTSGDWYTAKFIGLENYYRVFFKDVQFWQAIQRTLFLTIACVLTEFLLGLGLALLFTDNFLGKRFFTSAILLPMMVVPAATGYMFFMMFQRDGPINAILSMITGQEVKINWFVFGDTAMFTIYLADVWQWTPFMFLLMLSGLLALPQDPINAAKVLGASRWQVFRHVILPMMKPLITIALLLRGIEAFKIFDAAYIMTHGGPGTATQTVSMYMLEIGFRAWRLGYVAAEALLIVVAMLLFAWFVVRPIFLKRS